ncbi:MAG: tetratricopeptide repeat protein [Armatimonadota bacterium]
MTRRSLTAGMLVLLCLTFGFSYVFAAPVEKEKANTAVESPNWGGVLGRVYDAETGDPIRGARVIVQQDGVFAEKGKTVAITDEQGGYKCQAKIGKISNSMNLLSTLSAIAIGFSPTPIGETAKRLNVSRLTVQVQCAGYHTFEGIVRFRGVDAKDFIVLTQPILLTRLESAEVSTTADGWGTVGLLDVTLDPPIARPASKVQVTARLKCPADVRAKIVVKCYVNFLSDPLLLKRVQETPNEKQEDILTFAGTIFTPYKQRFRVEPVVVCLEKCPYDLIVDGKERTACLQVVPKGEPEGTAQLRLSAYQYLLDRNAGEAFKALTTLCKLPGSVNMDLFALAYASEAVHDYTSLVDARKRLLRNAPAKKRLDLLDDYAKALLLNDQADVVLRDVQPEVVEIKRSEWVDKVPVGVMVAIGMAYLKTGKLDEARQISEVIGFWPSVSEDPDFPTFRRDLRMAQAEAVLQANPNSAAAVAGYGRALIDQRRWEEAVEKLQAALRLEPTMTSVQYDLNYCLLHIAGGGGGSPQNLHEAVENAQKAVMITENKKVKKSKDFFAWHTLGLLLYRKACLQQQRGDHDAADTLKRSYEALCEALPCGRSGADIKEYYWQYRTTPNWGYTSQYVYIAGFAYPEGDSDYLILECLQRLKKAPDDYFALFNLATALIELEQYDLATLALQRCRQLKPEFDEATYAEAVIALRQGKTAQAKNALRQVVKVNPRHPRAHLTLAELYTADGDMVLAAECLAAHAQYYGKPSQDADIWKTLR